MLVRCTACSTVLTVPDDGGGRLFRCPACSTTIRVSEASNPSMPALALGDEGMVPPLEASPTMTDMPVLDEHTLASGAPSGMPSFVTAADVPQDQTVVDMRLQSDTATLPEEADPLAGEGAFQALDDLPIEPPADPSSQPPTSPSSQPPTEVPSQPPTEAPSQPPTEASSQPPTEVSSPFPTEVNSPLPTEGSSPPAAAGMPVAPGDLPVEPSAGATSDLPSEIPMDPSSQSPAGVPEETIELTSSAIESATPAVEAEASQIRGADDEIKVSAADVSAEREAQKSETARKKRGRIFSEGGTGLLLVFLTGITLGGAGILTFKEMELNQLQAEWESERRVQERLKPVLDEARKRDEELKLRVTRLRMAAATRPLDIRTAQQVGKVGFSGLNQAVITGQDGTRYRVFWGRLLNGRSTQVDAVRVLMEWVAPMKRGGQVQLEDRRGQANSLAFGRCPIENLKCLNRKPVVEVGDLAVAQNTQDAKAIVLRQMGKPGVSTIILPGGSVPFLLYEVADDGQQIDDAWLSVQLIEEAMPDRRYGRTKARKGKGKRRRRMRSRRRRTGP